MQMKWLDSAIENRIYEVAEELGKDKAYNDLRTRFMVILLELNKQFSIGGAYFELEELYNSTSMRTAEYSYKAGINEVLKIS